MLATLFIFLFVKHFPVLIIRKLGTGVAVINSHRRGMKKKKKNTSSYIKKLVCRHFGSQCTPVYK